MVRSDWRMRGALAVAVSALGVCMAAAGCAKSASAADKPRFQIEPQREAALGRGASEKILARHGGAFADNELTAYVDSVARRVVEKSSAAKTGRTFEFVVLDDADTTAAYALPDGNIYVTRALLRRLDSEAQLAGLIAHQVAHVVGQHAIARLVQDGVDPLKGDVAAASERLADASNDEIAEREADELAVRFVSEAGYDARGLIYAYRVIEDAPGARSGFFARHVSPEDRLDHLRSLVTKQRGPAGEAGEERYAVKVRARLSEAATGGSSEVDPPTPGTR